MRPQMRAAWPKFAAQWEGRVPHMYLDTLRLVTFGIGRKIDDHGRISEYGLTRPWRAKDGALVLESQIKLEWARVKAHTELAPKGGQAFGRITSLHLADADIDEALLDTSADFWAILARTIPSLEAWPADAQLALMDMAYHMGPMFLGPKWPNFTAAAKIANFVACSEDCQTAKRTRRDQVHAKLFTNAAAVSYADLDLAKLWGAGGRPIVTSWPTPGAALIKITASKVAAARPDSFSDHGWYVQRMLKLAGRYTAKIDGKFGPLSRGAFTAWAKAAKQPNTINAPTLRALSKVTLRMPVG